MYLAEFTLEGAAELADELLIQADSEAGARNVALGHASKFGLELFSIRRVSDRQLRLHRPRLLLTPHQLLLDDA